MMPVEVGGGGGGGSDGVPSPALLLERPAELKGGVAVVGGTGMILESDSD